MKLLVFILLAICGSVLCAPSDLEDNSKECYEKYNVKLEEQQDALTGKIKEAGVTNDMKCSILCAAEKDKLIKNGVFQPQNVAEAFGTAATKDQAAKISTECNVKGADDCDTGYKVGVCIAKIQHFQNV